MVAASVFRDIHAGIGYADDVFYRKTMYREAGYPETAGNLMLVQHRISRDPQAQALGQNLRLLHASFRHQDDELITAVSGHNVRLPAFLFEQAPDTRQHQITLKMTQGIVNFLEFIQVHEYHGERPP